MSKIPVSVCIIAKNEERYLEECLKKLKPYGMEIVVTDTGSTDATKEIAEKYADKVFDFEWIDDFSAARNFCAAHASNNWILSIDCDEYVESMDIRELRMLMQKFPKYVGNIQLKDLVTDEKGQRRYSLDEVTRFYNRNYYTYINAIHEQLVLIKEMEVGILYMFRISAEVVHHGYNISADEMAKKQQRNLKLLEKELEEKADDPYLWYQAGQSYYILQDYDKAIDAYEKGLSFQPDTKKAFTEIMVVSLSTAYLKAGRDTEALEAVKRYSGEFKSARYSYALAVAYLENGQLMQALLHFINTASMKDIDSLGDSKALCYESIITLYRQLGQPEMADLFVEKYEAALSERARVTGN